MPDLAEFHFLRPLWLLALVPALGIWAAVRRRTDPTRPWRGVIAPHLLAHLKTGGGTGWRFRPLHLVVGVLVLGSLAAAGPAWEREVSPFAEDTAPLVVALDLSRSMDAVDVQPTRLERAKQKVRDLLALRQGARTALLVYAGSAHAVLPLADDPSIFETFLSALETGLMPIEGKRPALALALAEELLAEEPVPGSILFITDGIAAEHAGAFTAHRETSRDEVLVLAVGTRDGGPVRRGDAFATDAAGRRLVATLDLEGLRTLEDEAGVFVAGVTVDSADVERLQRRVQSHLRQVRQDDETSRWHDAGYYLVYPIALLGLLWFRRGWTVRWEALVLAVLLTGCGADVWLTSDQQGRRLYERGDWAGAAERFEDPLWQGVAAYRAGDWERAIDAFSRSAAPAAAFNLGNAQARLERYEEAVASYETALAERPGWREAEENLERVRALIPREEEPPEGNADPSFEADEVVFDERGEKGERGEVDRATLTDDQLAEMWMRRLQTSPADFLRRRFAAEAVDR